MRDIIIIGSGNVAYHLAKAFVQKKIPVKQIFGRNESALQNIHKDLNIPYSTEKLQSADVYLICVSDSSIPEVSEIIHNSEALVAHTSGSMPLEILKGNYRKACFYPLQTFSKNKELVYHDIPFFIEAEHQKDEEFLEHLATIISPHVMKADYEKRKYIHLTAVFACNFANHLFARAKEISDRQNIPFQYFLPLIDETCSKIHHLEPKEAQTGPAVRNDRRILSLHQELLEGEALKIYNTLNHSIQEMYHLPNN